MTAFILSMTSLLTGLSALFAQSLQRLLRPLLNKTFHNFLGIVTFILALVTQYYGYETWIFKMKVSEDFEIMMKVITIFILFLTCIGPLKALYPKSLSIVKN